MHDNAINNSRLTAQIAGTYYIWGSLDFGTGNPFGAWIASFIHLNGTTHISAHSAKLGFDGSVIETATLYKLGVGDYVELIGRSSGIDTVLVSPQYSPEMGMQLIGEVGFDHGARVYRATDQTGIAAGAWTAISFSAFRWDTNSFWNVGAPTRLTIPFDGRYSITGHLQCNSSLPGIAVGIRLNGSTYIQVNRTAGGWRCGVPSIYEFSAGDYIEMMVQFDGFAARNVTTNINFSPEFSIQMISEL